MSKIDDWIKESFYNKASYFEETGCLALGCYGTNTCGCELLLVTQYMDETRTVSRRCLKYNCRKYLNPKE